MRKKHGFFVVDIQYVINLKKLLKYITEKIHIGNICLYCDKRKTSNFAVQQHMVYLFC